MSPRGRSAVADTAIQRLEDLERSDPSVARLAALQAEALRACADPSWRQGMPAWTGALLDEGVPLLHGQTLLVDPRQLARLLDRLGESAERAGTPAVAPLRRALRGAAIEPLALAQAA